MSKLNKVFNYLILILVLGYGAFYAYTISTQKEKPSGGYELSSNDIEQVVNKYLKQTTDNMQKEKWNSQKAIHQALKQPIVMTNNTKEINPADIPSSRQIWKDADVQNSPADVINTDLYNEALSDQQDEEARQQYARDFIENARRGGFHVVLSPDLTKIISVTPIRKPSQQDDSFETSPSN